MSRPDRVVLASLVVALAVAGGACGGGPPSGGSTSCSSDEECRPDARCSSGGCVVNTPPIADFAVTGDLQANSVVTLDGSASSDPDHGDLVTSYSWEIDTEEASCAPPVLAGTDAVVQVRFGCAGRFRAQLVVVDAKHLESVPASRVIDIAPRSAPGLVQAGPDQAVDHACAGSPLTCRPSGAVQLAATITAQAPVSVRWTVQPPPGRELDAHRRVRFVPDASAQNPRVEIETDGAAISGDWLFRIEVRDGIGALDTDTMRVTVANHAPAIRGGPSLPFPHLFDASNRRFTSSGTFPVEVTDEDGDPVVRKVTFHHTGDGGAAFTGEDLGSAVRFAVSVPYVGGSDALFLRGGAGLERSAAFTATDVNGTSSTAVFAVEIGDQGPVGRGTTTYLAADHTYDPSARAYLAKPVIGRWTDPDGDPLTHAVAADPVCPAFVVEQDGTVRLHCSSAFTTMGSLEDLLGNRRATVVVSDPWQSVTSTPSFWIGDSPPAFSGAPVRVEVECRSVLSCVYTQSRVVSVPVGVTDPDGDPVEVMPSAGGRSAQCFAGGPCTMAVTVPEVHACTSALPAVEVPVVATDGHVATTGSIAINPVCR